MGKVRGKEREEIRINIPYKANNIRAIPTTGTYTISPSTSLSLIPPPTFD